jgi:hypothetical protein
LKKIPRCRRMFLLAYKRNHRIEYAITIFRIVNKKLLAVVVDKNPRSHKEKYW